MGKKKYGRTIEKELTQEVAEMHRELMRSKPNHQLDWDNSTYLMMKELAKRVTLLEGEVQKVTVPGMIDGERVYFERPMCYIDPLPILSTGMADDIEDFVMFPPDGVYVNIDYSDGYATYQGMALWEKLQQEKVNYYNLFKLYLEHRDSIRHVTGNTIASNEAIKKIAEDLRINTKHLKVLSKVYQWQKRYGFYEDYLEILKERKRKLEVQEMKNRHKTAAESLFNKLTRFLDEMDLRTVSVKDMNKLLEMAIKLERLSLGLPGDKPSDGAKESSKSSSPAVQINVGGSGTPQIPQADSADNAILLEKSMEVADILKKVGAFVAAEKEAEKENSIDVEYTEVGEDNDGEEEDN